MVIEKDRVLFNTLATSLAPFAASQRSLKILANEGRISCDPSEILEAHDPGDSLPLFFAARVCRRYRALWSPRAGKTSAAFRSYAEWTTTAFGWWLATCSKDCWHCLTEVEETGAQSGHGFKGVIHTWKKALKSQGCELANAAAGSEDLEELLFGSDISDEVSWFFSSANDKLDAAGVDPVSTDFDIVEAPGPSYHAQGDVLDRVSFELCRRCRGTFLDRSGSGAGQQCFVYGRIKAGAAMHDIEGRYCMSCSGWLHSSARGYAGKACRDWHRQG